MNKIFFAIVAIGLCVSTNLFADSLDIFKNEAGTIRIAGGTAHIPVMKEAAQRVMQTNHNIRISIAGGGSGVGIKQVGEGLVDIGNSGRKAKDEEIEKYGLKMFKWAIDSVAIVVNPQNPAHKLSKEQLKGIFSGKITNWKELGGIDKHINIYTRDNSSGTREVFWKKALDKGDISPKANFVVSNGAMKSAIAADPYAIGYVSTGHIDKSISPVSLDGVIPEIETVKNGQYPVARGLYSNTKGEPNRLTKMFLDYLFSPEGQKIVSEKGFIPVK